MTLRKQSINKLPIKYFDHIVRRQSFLLNWWVGEGLSPCVERGSLDGVISFLISRLAQPITSYYVHIQSSKVRYRCNKAIAYYPNTEHVRIGEPFQ